MTRSGLTALPSHHFLCRMYSLALMAQPNCMMYPLGSHDQSSHQLGTRKFSTSFTDFPTQELKPHSGCCQTNLSGIVWPSKSGPGPIYPVNSPGSINTPKHTLATMNHLGLNSAMSTATLLTPYLFHNRVARIYWPRWTVMPTGPKLSLSTAQKHKKWAEPSSQITFHSISVHNSSQSCGMIILRWSISNHTIKHINS